MIYSKRKNNNNNNNNNKNQPPIPIDVMYVVHLDFWRTRTEKRDWRGQSSVPTMLDKTLVMVRLIHQQSPETRTSWKGRLLSLQLSRVTGWQNGIMREEKEAPLCKINVEINEV